MDEKIVRDEDEWRRRLTPEQFAVCRRKGTEPPFTGRYWNTKTPGRYLCACCGLELFDWRAKYDSGSGWPSFWQPIAADRVENRVDESHGMIRTEVVCRRCGSHLGHVFDDGPPPTGLRYCINSAALMLKPEAAG